MSGHRAAELLLFALAYIAGHEEWVGLGRPFFMAWNDTHGGADKKVRPYPDIKQTEYVTFKEETNNGKSGNDPHPAEGL